jgi:hypothetical protein
MLLGPVLLGLGSLIYLNLQSSQEIKAQAAKAVYALEAPPVPSPTGFEPENAVVVPLTNGLQLFVTDCNRLHPWVVVSERPAPETLPKDFDFQAEKKPKSNSGVTLDLSTSIPVTASTPGQTNGNDCVYFADEKFQKLGGRLTALPLGDADQIAIEKEYWAAYANAKHEHHIGKAMAAAFISLWGFPAGIILWTFYRLVRFAVKG